MAAFERAWSGTTDGGRVLHTGRDYSQLSIPRYRVLAELDERIKVSDGTTLLADVFRPAATGAFPTLLSVSPYPRQIQGWRAPAGFVQAGNTDFFVRRGYVHVVANLRGAGGSEGRFGFGDATERQDVIDLVAWTASQTWCNGTIGMLGAGYFANAALAAAVDRPPGLAAVFAVSPIPRRWEPSSVDAFCRALATANGPADPVWRHKLLGAARHLAVLPSLHSRWEHQTGTSAADALAPLLHGWVGETWPADWPPPEPAPTDPDTHGPPVYLVHDPLDGPAAGWECLAHDPNARLAITAPGTISWPWSTLHIEALAWFDRWLHDRDTGVTAGPQVRHWLDGRWTTAGG